MSPNLNSPIRNSTKRSSKRKLNRGQNLLRSKIRINTLNKRAIQDRKIRQIPIVAFAEAKGIRMSPLKVRRVLQQIQGCSYEEALILLRFLPYRACYPVAKVLKSAAANASNNYQVPKSFLQVQKAWVGPGPILKRMHPRSKGRGFPILKRTSHISIMVQSTFTRYEKNLSGDFKAMLIK